jgi:hypothetical protein
MFEHVNVSQQNSQIIWVVVTLFLFFSALIFDILASLEKRQKKDFLS